MNKKITIMMKILAFSSEVHKFKIIIISGLCHAKENKILNQKNFNLSDRIELHNLRRFFSCKADIKSKYREKNTIILNTVLLYSCNEIRFITGG